MNNENNNYSENSFYNDTNSYESSSYDTNATNISYEERAVKDLSQKSMIYGIVAVSIAYFCGCLFIASIVLGIMSLLNISKAKKNFGVQKLNGQQIAGMVCSIIALAMSAFYLLFAIFYIFMIVFVGFFAAMGA